MLFVDYHIGKGPFYTLDEINFSYRTYFDLTQTTALWQAGIRMDEYLHRKFIVFVDLSGYFLYLLMCLLQCIVVWHGGMAVQMQGAAILYHAQVVYIYPLVTSMCIEMGDDRAYDIGISFIHDAL